MKRLLALLMTLALLACLIGAQAQTAWPDAAQILLSDEGVTVNGQPASADPTAAVYTANGYCFLSGRTGFHLRRGRRAGRRAADRVCHH